MCGEWRIHWLRKKQTSGVKSVVGRNSSSENTVTREEASRN